MKCFCIARRLFPTYQIPYGRFFTMLRLTHTRTKNPSFPTFVQKQKHKSYDDLRTTNEQLKAENTALVRIVEKLGGTPTSVTGPASGVGAEVTNVAEQKNEDREIKFILGDSTDNSETVVSRTSSSSSSQSVEETDGSSAPTTKRGSRETLHTRSESPALKRISKLESSSSTPSLFSSTYSSRRGPSSYRSQNNDHSTTEYDRSSSYTPYRSSRKDLSSTSTGSYTIPVSSTRSSYLRTLPPSSPVMGRSTLRTSPIPYSSSYSSSKSSYSSPSSKSTYGSSSRPRSGYSSSSNARTGSSNLTGLGSSRRPLKY